MLKTLRTPAAQRILLMVVAAALFVAAMVGAPRPAQACHDWTEYFTYYSDATKTTEVGWCEYDCYCVTYCEGQKTQYWNHSVWNGCL